MGTRQEFVYENYNLTRKIGEGKRAEIFEAVPEGKISAKPIAIKHLKSAFADDEGAAQQFVEGAKRAALLSHPNIVSCFHLGKTDGQPFAILEIVPGIDLMKALAACRKRHEHVPLDVALVIAWQLCEALSYAHTRAGEDGSPSGVAHGDVEPSHVLLSYEGAVKLTGFGHGGKDYGADVQAVGAILFEMLAGHKFHEEKSKIPEAIPQQVKAMLFKALAVEPDARYGSAGEFGQEIKRYLETHFSVVSAQIVARFVSELGGAPWEEKTAAFGDGQGAPPEPPPPAPAERTDGNAASNKTLQLLGAFSALAIAIGFILGGLYQKAQDTSPQPQKPAVVSQAPKIEQPTMAEPAVPAPPVLRPGESIMMPNGEVISGKEPVKAEELTKPRASVGEVIILTEPPGARVIFDDREIPVRTPLTVSNVPLDVVYAFTLIRDGYAPAVEIVELKEESRVFNIKLKKTGVAQSREEEEFGRVVPPEESAGAVGQVFEFKAPVVPDTTAAKNRKYELTRVSPKIEAPKPAGVPEAAKETESALPKGGTGEVGEVVITSNPPRASVVFDGQSIPAPTPVTIKKVPVGRAHSFSVALDGYSSVDRTFSMDAKKKSFNISLISGETATVNPRDSRDGKADEGFGEVVITTSPPRAAIVFDGQSIPAPTPVTIRKVPMGKEHSFHVVSEGYLPESRDFRMDEGSKSFSISLKPSTTANESRKDLTGFGEVVITSDPSGAQVVFDSRIIPVKTPVTISKVPLGEDHIFDVNYEGHLSGHRLFRMDEKTKSFNITLEELW